MNADHEDGEIRRLFRQLAAEDEQLARPFPAYLEAMRRRAAAARRGKPSPRLAAAALAALLLAGAAVAIWRQARPARPRAEAAVAELSRQSAQPRGEVAIAMLSRWRPPTDALLRTPGDQLLRTVPRVGTPLHDQSLFGGETR
jgi:hypothetical protein